MVGLLECSVQVSDLDLVILMGPFQLSLLCDSWNFLLCPKTCAQPPVSPTGEEHLCPQEQNPPKVWFTQEAAPGKLEKGADQAPSLFSLFSLPLFIFLSPLSFCFFSAQLQPIHMAAPTQD